VVNALVVDDSAGQARATAALLSRAGYRPVRTATDWAHCRSQLTTEPAALVVLDVHMGGQVSGDVMVAQLRRMPGCASSRFILYSAMKQRDLEAVARRCGADAFVAKGDDNAFLTTCTRLVPLR